MPRTPRKYIDGQHFHIMVQGIGKEYIFPAEEFKGYYIICLQKFKQNTNTKILGFCVMGNHAHILLSVDSVVTLALFMKSVNFEYARYYNRMRKRVGYVFRERYKSEVIKNIKYLVYCLAYIHNNPVKAKMIKNAKDYKYSSYRNYLTGDGAIDFKEASKYYDVSSENIRAIMKEKSMMEWLEHDDKEYEDEYVVLEDLMRKYDIDSREQIKNNNLLKKVVGDLQERSGISLRRAAILLGVNREWLRKTMSITPSL